MKISMAKKLLFPSIIIFGLVPAIAKVDARHLVGPTIDNQPEAIKARHSVGPTIDNQPDAIKARHLVGPTIDNQPEAIKARHSVGPTIENQPYLIGERHSIKVNGKYRSTKSQKLKNDQKINTSELLDLNQE